MAALKCLGVYCGSNAGHRSAYADMARTLGTLLAEEGIGLVYGGGRVGLMGIIADAVLEAGGEAIGVIPYSLAQREVAHEGLTELRLVDSMHERKALMAELADAFVAMPGGLGTLEELAEALTWSQLGIHQKPCGLLNVAGYYDGLIAFFDHAESEGFVRSQHRELLLVDDQPHALLARLRAFEPTETTRWITRREL
jgi:uncharacterized protein (TIGR00730 family)